MSLVAQTVLQNRYRIVTLLGQGGMGAVYRAWDLRLSTSVALKEHIPQPGLDMGLLAQLRQQFEQEAMTLAHLSHPNLVRVTDFFEEGGNVYLVMDLLQGESLADRILREGALPEAQVLVWAAQLLDALAYCHGQGIVHRDIKPQNILLRPDGRAVLVDFGLVKLWNPNDPLTRTVLRGMGTPEYAPPEQYGKQGQTTDPRSDIYSLGATIYHALTGQAPPTASDRMADPDSFKLVRTLNPRVSATTEMAILRALEPARDRRWLGAAEMASALAGAPVMSRTQIQPQSQFATNRQRFPLWIWVIGAIAGLALLIAGFGALRGRAHVAPTITSSPTSALDITVTFTPTPDTPTPTLTATATATPTPTGTPTATSTQTPTPTSTASPTPTPFPPLNGRIAFARNAFGSDYNNREIYSLDLATGNVVRLTQNNVPDWNPDWSPDGQSLAWVSYQSGDYDIWVMARDGSRQSNRIALPAWDDYPVWSPDGAQIAFISTGTTSGVANSEVFIGSNTGNSRRLTFNTGADEWPSWSPDGQWLAVGSDRGGDYDIYLFTVDGGNTIQWTRDPAYDEQPNWSPDGQWIAFIRKTMDTNGNGHLDRRDDGDFGDIWIGRRNGTDFRQLTFDARAADPAWSPEGTHIVFTHFKDSNGDGNVGVDDASDLWVISVATGERTILTEGPEHDWAPDWTR